ncbi:MAG TPA: hypothetical protein VFM06_10590, partial [Candidatus Limnocylindria bacterium]|nr:hypothetical protein [Candidatus Limnocylindria bacterium]
ALAELRANEGTQFNPVVVEAFIATLEGAKVPSAKTHTTQIFQQALAAISGRSERTAQTVKVEA